MGLLTFLGTGTSTGVPIIGCRCEVCRSGNPRDKRLRSSVWVRDNGASVLVDTATDLREQALRANITEVDAVLYTHHHADHVHGIDELRSFNFLQRRPVRCYGAEESLARIRSMFAYIFDDKEPEGGGKPVLELIPVDGPIHIGSLTVIPAPVKHGSADVLGFRFGGTAYITDCSYIPLSSEKLLHGLDTLILGALGLKRHRTHFTIEEALAVIESLRPKRAYLTHLNHSVGAERTSGTLPDNVELAWDGLTIDF